jgi:uncharacterized damage-inducible protein DinB
MEIARRIDKFLTNNNMKNLDELRFPIGKFSWPENYDVDVVKKWIVTIETFPEKLSALVANLSEKELRQCYKPDGWNVRQVVHHCADSHMQSFARFKLALTEDEPIIKAYYEDRWAELPDTIEPTVDSSISILKGLHNRWVVLLKKLSEEDLEKCFVHPESGRKIKLWENIALYVWHCNHHYAHIETALKNPTNH